MRRHFGVPGVGDEPISWNPIDQVPRLRCAGSFHTTLPPLVMTQIKRTFTPRPAMTHVKYLKKMGE